jgi:hypothetical protein
MYGIGQYAPYSRSATNRENDPHREHFSSVDTIKRSSSWFAVDQAVQVAGESTQPEFTGKMIELSAAGIRLRIDRPLRLGSAVELSWNGMVVSTEVRKCIAARSDFLVECSSWRVVSTGRRAAAAQTR